MATGVRFTISGSNTDFETEEIERVEVEPLQSFQVQARQMIRPDLYLEGDTWLTVTVEFHERWATTRAKIETVQGADVEMALFPHYAFRPAYFLHVILVPDNIVKTYRYGEREASVTHRMTFLESR